MSTVTSSISSLSESTEFDTNRSEEFGQRMVGMLNEAALSFMLSIGHRSGLLDTLRRLNRPATTHEIADEADLDERYVREWLGAMVTGRVVDYDPHAATYFLPQEHAAWLTRKATPNNLAGVMQFMSMFGKIEDDVLECFHHGGGVPYERFDRFHEVMAEESFQTVVAALDDYILPLIEGLTESLTRGIDVVDVGCGRGMALTHLAKKFPNSRFVGYDFSAEAIAWANNEAECAGLTNIRFEVQDAARLTDEQRFDLVLAFDAIHDQIDPHGMLAGIARALKDDGVFLAQDIRSSSYVEKNLDHPVAPFLYTISISTMHCMTVSLAHCGCGLGTCWGEELALKMFAEAGFSDVEVHTLDHDIMNNYYVSRKR
ncbi:class I SAM-dependent methyltransferase [Rubinisphaera margarita]|uniref:class I SAM-dependent methyltransferase n=1 Tax=Rubinisphaera margarita TaxID=2909586 RepID=UPI001EE8E180|nr:class I SAM-dependent methyltransferase [Rubinisphaera margarita]MCG6154807.1 class I SAM-dependent methyltransferase [Rubinisphaera margarita]